MRQEPVTSLAVFTAFRIFGQVTGYKLKGVPVTSLPGYKLEGVPVTSLFAATKLVTGKLLSL